MLGIGTNGHIGFNEPARELVARTHRVRLKASTRRSNAALFRRRPRASVPREALSVGMGSILQARRILLMATGKSKARCVAGCGTGPITTKLPASFLQLHRTWSNSLDEVAAGDGRRAGRRRRSDTEQLTEARLDVFAERLADELSALRSRFIACGSVRSAFCMTIAVFTFHLARLAALRPRRSSTPVTTPTIRRARSFSFSDPVLTSTIKLP